MNIVRPLLVDKKMFEHIRRRGKSVFMLGECFPKILFWLSLPSTIDTRHCSYIIYSLSHGTLFFYFFWKQVWTTKQR